MSILDTRHKKKSFTLTIFLLSALLLLMFYLGLSYLEPPIENGITVNFGTMEFGYGEEQPRKKVKTQPVSPQKPEEEKTSVQPSELPEEEVEEKKDTDKPAEELLTRENEETVKIEQRKQKEREAEAAKEKARQQAERLERERRAEEERIRKEQEAKKQKLDALMGGLQTSEGEVEGGEGDDALAGDKGSPEGDPYAATSYGPGSGSGTGSYGLKGRSLMSKEVVKQKCNEQGIVVVKIIVDNRGKVIEAIPGQKGTTNTERCLMDPARETAFNYQWNADPNAPNKQVGFVVVNFKLGE